MDEAVNGSGGAAGMRCAHCGQAMPAGSRFCEKCGSELAAPSPGPDGAVGASATGDSAGTDELDGGVGFRLVRTCSGCGGHIAADGYCEQCGKPGGSDRDHWVERPAPWVAGVCDRGLRHAKNEDAMSVGAAAALGYVALVVCDGVTSAPGSEMASLAAARAAGRELLAGAEAVVEVLDAAASQDVVAADPDTAPDPVRTLRELLIRSAALADRAIEETVGDMAGAENPPSCTFVAAVAVGPLIVTGWIGDSRAYWLPDEGEPRQLSIDDSWAQEMIRQGIDRAQAESAPQAHAITRWLGPDAPEGDAQTMSFRPDRPGWLLVCSDGLWNYASAPEDMAAVFRSAVDATDADPGAVAENLIAWANDCGGRDNITAIVARHPAYAVPVSSTSVDH